MYVTDVIWWSYTVFLALIALFMVLFTWRVTRKEG